MNRILLFIALLAAGFVSCRDNKHQMEQGISVSFVNEGLSSDDVRVWVFNGDSTIHGESKHFSSIEQLAATRLEVPLGQYTVVAALGASHDFDIIDDNSITTLLLGLASNPATYSDGVYYGAKSIEVGQGEYSTCYINAEPIYTGFKARIHNIIEGVEKIEFFVTNSSEAFNPATGTYTAEREVQIPQTDSILDRVAEFGLTTMMQNPTGSELMFKVIVHYEDAKIQTKELTTQLIVESQNWYSISINFAEISLGYINVGNVTTNPWEDTELNGDFE